MSTITSKKSTKKSTSVQETAVPVSVVENVDSVQYIENNNLDENLVDLDLNLAEFSVNNLTSKTLAEKRELYVKIVTLINKYIVKVKSLDKLPSSIPVKIFK